MLVFAGVDLDATTDAGVIKKVKRLLFFFLFFSLAEMVDIKQNFNPFSSLFSSSSR